MASLAGSGGRRAPAVAVAVLVVLAVGRVAYQPAAQARVTARCGVERWAVKTLTDADAKVVRGPVIPATVGALGLAEPYTHDGPRQPFERHLYRVTAKLTWAKIEADGDVHLVLTDQGNSMIAESPATSCTRGAQRRYAMAVARTWIDKNLAPSSSFWRHFDTPVVVTGVGFLDRDHGQRGVAPNAVELHPVTGIRWVS